MRELISNLVTEDACSEPALGGCELVIVDGEPHLRLGPNCGLLEYVKHHWEPRRERVSLDRATNELAYGARRISLTRSEFRLFEVLMQAEGDLCSYDDLVAGLWRGRELKSGRGSIRNLVGTIRTKLRAAGLPDQLIVSVHGTGLRLRS